MWLFQLKVSVTEKCLDVGKESNTVRNKPVKNSQSL